MLEVTLPSIGDSLPLYHVVNGRAPQPAFLELYLDASRAIFDWQSDPMRAPAAEPGQILRWAVPENVRSSCLVELAEDLRPYLEVIVTGALYSREKRAYILDQASEDASDRIADILAELSVADGHLAPIWPAAEYVEEFVSTDREMTADISDEHLDQLAAEYGQEAERDGYYIDGSLRQAMSERRQSLRQAIRLSEPS